VVGLCEIIIVDGVVAVLPFPHSNSQSSISLQKAQPVWLAHDMFDGMKAIQRNSM
jgi:hypothetical protein